MEKYDPRKIEQKWQEQWEQDHLYEALAKNTDKKYYVLVEFPYPSSDGLHTGHVRSYTALDAVARKRRAEGYNVLYPMGWDAFGLPTENFAIKTGTHPREVTKQNTDNFRRQLKSLGFSFDWSREIDTTNPCYYKWTQWIFIQLFKHGLAYKAKMPINWCLSCKIGLANEEVVEGRCERCDGETEKRDKEQWMLAITKYADRLDKDLEEVGYLERIKIQQRNWIGRSEGAEIRFKIQDSGSTEAGEVSVFTTRPDTLFGATYIVLAPEHPLLFKLKAVVQNWDEVGSYINEARQKSELERTAEGKEKTGVELRGLKAVNPANKEEIPVFVADYVLAGYGTGAIMGVPAHDERDFAFAKKYGLPVRQVVAPCFVREEGDDAFCNEEPVVEREAITAIVKHWERDAYAVLRWKQVDWHTFITGGVEEGQTPEEAARAEVFEETGYKNIKVSRELSRFHAKFFHVPKQVNRFAHFHTFYFELEDGERDEVSEEEGEKHELVWLTAKQLEALLTPPGHLFVWKELKEGYVPYTEEGVLVHSGTFDGMDSGEAKQKITEFVGGEIKTTYRLRDWVFSRQRYWGEPIPMVHCEKCGWVSLPENELPLELPSIEKYQPTDTGESPLAHLDEWVNTTCPQCGGPAKRETDVMPNWAGSSWYYLAYIMQGISNFQFPISQYKTAYNYWLPVDWYNGGMEHTTLHLLYSRFWHKFLFDIGVVPTKEPYAKRTSHGLVLAEDGQKMSKSKGNTVSPESVIEQFGADALRVYELFMGPFDQPIPWSTDNIVGSRRFLERVWRLQEKVGDADSDSETERILHQTVKKVGEDIESLKFNTAISQLMICSDALDKSERIDKKSYEILLRLLAVFAPHITEELYARLGNRESIHVQPWPAYDESKLSVGHWQIPVQVNGKVRAQLEISEGESKTEITQRALALDAVRRWIGGEEPDRVVYVEGKLVNIVSPKASK